MAQTGLDYTFLVGKETTYGTKVTANQLIGIVTNYTFNNNRTPIEIRNIGQREATGFQSGMIEGSGSVSFQYQHGRLFEAVLGTDTDTASSSDRVHTWNGIGASPSYTLRLGSANANIGWEIKGCKFNGLTLNWGTEGVFNISGNFTGQVPTKLTSLTDPTQLALPVFPLQDTALSINGTPVSEVQSIKITLNNNISKVKSISSVSVTDLKSTQFKVTWEMTIGYANASLHDFFIGNSVTAIKVSTLNGKAVGSGRRGMEIELQKVIVEKFSEAIRLGNITYADISGSAIFKSLVSWDNISSY